VNTSPTGLRHVPRSSTTRRIAVIRWSVTAAATIASALALEALATAGGVALVAANILSTATIPVLVVVLGVTYLLWIAALRVNVVANWNLLESTGTSTNPVSKLLHDLAAARHFSRRTRRTASALGYVATELAKEVPYYLGAFGAAVLADSVDSAEAIVFLAGTNIGAAAYELGLARLTCRGLLWRSRRAARFLATSSPAGTVP
jgi:hypothetical protein